MERILTRRKPRKLKNHFVLFVDGEVECEYLKHININQRENVKFDIKLGDENNF
jgi:hypothetical protein